MKGGGVGAFQSFSDVMYNVGNASINAMNTVTGHTHVASANPTIQ